MIVYLVIKRDKKMDTDFVHAKIDLMKPMRLFMKFVVTDVLMY